MTQTEMLTIFSLLHANASIREGPNGTKDVKRTEIPHIRSRHHIPKMMMVGHFSPVKKKGSGVQF